MERLLLLVCFVAASAASVWAQDFITQGEAVDPAWARLTNAAQHVTASKSDRWGSLNVVDGYPVEIILDEEPQARVNVMCHPDRSVTLVFEAADEVASRFTQIEDDFFFNIDYQCTTPEGQDCKPQVDDTVFNAFMDSEDDIKEAIDACSSNSSSAQLITTTGSLLGSGAYAGMGALWAVEQYPGSVVSCITFNSAWANLKVDQAFMRVFTHSVGFYRNTDKPYSFYSGAQVVSSAGEGIPERFCTSGTVLCKVQPYVELACQLYNPTMLTGAFPKTIVLAAGANRASIQWFEPVGTAVFAFANLGNIYDTWINAPGEGYKEPTSLFTDQLLNMDRALWQSTADLYKRNLAGEPMIYQQFVEPFASLQQASATVGPLSCTGLYDCFNALSGRAIPTNVVVTGHALGGAAAMLGGTWAAIAFPESTIQVVTAGAPANIGNNFYYEVFNTLVGTAYQVVNGLDPVPRFPPCKSGTQLGLPGGMYINGTLMDMQTNDPYFEDNFQSCSASIPLKDQDCALYVNSMRRVQKVRVSIGPDLPVGGATQQFIAPAKRR